MKLLALLPLLPICLQVSAQDFTGRWYSQVHLDGKTTVNRMLGIGSDGKCELLTSYSGKPPTPNKGQRERLGSLVDDLVNSSQVSHTGNWRVDRGRLKVDLVTVKSDSTRELKCHIDLELKNGVLSARAQDRGAYGKEALRFARSPGGSPGGDKPISIPTQPPTKPPSEKQPVKPPAEKPSGIVEYIGRYQGTFKVPSGTAEIRRSLQLGADGRAYLTTELVGRAAPNFTRSDIDEYGGLLEMLTSKRSFVHVGGWTRRSDVISVSLSYIDKTRAHAVLVFVKRGNELRSEQVDRDRYGKTSFTLKKS